MTTENTEQQIVDGVDGFFTKLTEAATVISEKLIEVAPDVANAFLNLVQAKGIFDICFSILLSGFLITGTWISAKTLMSKERDYQWDVIPPLWAILTFLGGAASIFSFFHIFNFYNWVAAFYPEGAIAMKALEAAGISL